MTACDGLREAGLLDGAAIAPPLLARALYAGIPPARRARMHAGAARFGGAAYHLLRSEPSADPWVVQTLRRVAEQALDGGRPQDAAALLRRAAREGVSDERADLLLELARAEQRLADGNEIARLEAALESRRAAAASRPARWRGRCSPTAARPTRSRWSTPTLRSCTPARGCSPARAAAAAARLKAAAEDSPALLACRAARGRLCRLERRDRGRAGRAGRSAIRALDPEAPAFFLACAALAWSDRLALAREQLERALAHARALRLGRRAGARRSRARGGRAASG